MRRYDKVTYSYRSTAKPRRHRFDIGVYSSEEKAMEAITRLKKQKGFCDEPEGFRITPRYLLRKPNLLDKTLCPHCRWRARCGA